MGQHIFDCAWCGKHVELEWKNGRRPKYCCTDCRKHAKYALASIAREERNKTRRLNRRQKIVQWQKAQKTPLVPVKHCERCQWGVWSQSNCWCCGYSDVHDHTRTSMHPGGLTGECKEFAERIGARLNLRRAMSLTKVPSNWADRSGIPDLDQDIVRMQEKIRRYLNDKEGSSLD